MQTEVPLIIKAELLGVLYILYSHVASILSFLGSLSLNRTLEDCNLSQFIKQPYKRLFGFLPVLELGQ